MPKKLIALFKTNYFVGASLIYIICSFLQKGISFITTPIFTRIMAPSDFGVTSAVSTWVTFVSIIICCQVSSAIAPARVHKKQGEFETFVGNITVFGLLSAAFVLVIMLFFRTSFGNLMGIEPNLIGHVVLQSYGAALTAVCTMYLIQTKKPKMHATVTIILTLTNIFVSLALVLSIKEAKYMGRVWGSTITNCIAIPFFLIYFLRKAELRIDKLLDDWKYALCVGFPLIFHLLSNTVLGLSDRLFIAKMIGENEAGVYTVAYSIGIVGMIFADACNNAWSPWYLENTRENNTSEINKMAKKYILIITFCFMELFLLSAEVLEIMAPEPYWGAKNTVLFVILGVFFQYLYRFPQAYETYQRNLKWTAFCTTCAAVLNCILNYVLISQYGIDGAALATLISYIALFIGHEIVARVIIKGFNISAKHYIIPIGLCLLTGFVSYLALPYRWIRVLLAVIIGCLAMSIAYRKVKQKEKKND